MFNEEDDSDFEDSFPNIIDRDDDADDTNDGTQHQHQLKTGAFSEKVNRLQEQIRTAQHIREALSADIDLQKKTLAAFQEEKEKDVMKIPVYDPYNEILSAEQESTNDANDGYVINDKGKSSKQKYSRAELARILGKTTNQARIQQRDKNIVNRLLLHHLGGRFNHLPEGLHGNNGNKNGLAAQANFTQPVVRVRTGDRVTPELKFYAIPSYTFKNLHDDVCHFYGVPVDEYEIVGIPAGSKYPDDVCIEEEFRPLFATGETLIVEFCQKVPLPQGQLPTFQHPNPTFIDGKTTSCTSRDIMKMKNGSYQSRRNSKNKKTNSSNSSSSNGMSNESRFDAPPKEVVYTVQSLWSTITLIILFTLCVLLQRNVQSMYFTGKAVYSGLFKRKFGLYQDKVLLDINTAEDIYHWLKGPMATFVQPGSDNLIRHSFKQVGAVRIRQMRVDLNDGCSMTPQLAVWERERQRDEDGGGLVTFVEGCYASYLYFYQSKGTYGDGTEGFVYNSATEPSTLKILSTNAGISNTADLKYENDLWTIGKFGLYNPSGHAIEFAPGSSEKYIIKQIHRLQKNHWIDAQTRAIIININLYNINYNYFVSAQITMEFSLTGGIFISDKLNIYSLEFIDKARPLELAGEIIGCVAAAILIGTIGKLTYTACRIGVTYFFKNIFNTTELIMGLCWLTATLIKFALISSPYRTRLVGSVLKTQQQYVAMSTLVEVIQIARGFESIALFLGYFQVFKYYGLFPQSHSVWLTVANSTPILLSFLVFFLCIFIGFAIFGHVIFAKHLVDFKSFMTSISTLLQYVYGDINAANGIEAEPFWGPLFFGSYAFIVNLMLYNCGISIIFFTYSAIIKAQKKLDLKEATQGLRPRYYPLSLIQFLEIASGGLISSAKEIDSIAIEAQQSNARMKLLKRMNNRMDKMKRIAGSMKNKAKQLQNNVGDKIKQTKGKNK